MNAPAHMRRGACPGLSAPMPTGDGLLARLTPNGTIELAAFAGLCEAARRFGNGIVEVTSRGSIQVRGLSAASSPLFAAEVAALAIQASDGIPVLASPLAENDAIARDIRTALAGAALPPLSAKLSVIVDTGGALHLDQLAADIRLRTIGSDCVHVALGGDAASAMPLGSVRTERAAECVVRLLRALKPGARMRSNVAGAGIEAFRSAGSGFVSDIAPPPVRPAADPIGMHSCAPGVALGIGLPFGHSDAATLVCLIDAAQRHAARGLRTAPGRALLLLGLSRPLAEALAAEARALGFIVDPADPRRRVVACAGAPVCASGQIPTRALAPAVAEVAARLPAGEFVHLSGCAKGCAHPAAAPLTVIGRAGVCDIIVNDALRDSVSADALPSRLAELVRA